MDENIQTEFVHLDSLGTYIAYRLLSEEEIKELQSKTEEELSSQFLFIGKANKLSAWQKEYKEAE